MMIQIDTADIEMVLRRELAAYTEQLSQVILAAAGYKFDFIQVSGAGTEQSAYLIAQCVAQHGDMVPMPARARPDVIEAIRQLVFTPSNEDRGYVAPYVAGHNDALRSVLRLLEGTV